MTIADLKSRPGMSGFDFHAKIERILGQYRTGTGQYGPYSFQDLMLADDTGKVLVTVKNHPEIPANAVGKVMSVKCKSFNGILRGTIVKQEQDEDADGNSQTIVKLEVTKTATILIGNNDTIEQTATQQTVAHTTQSTVDPRQSWIDTYIEAGEILASPQVKATLEACVASGWSSEDLRTLATTIALSRSRR